MEPKRLLCFVSSMDAGGAETFLMKVYRVIDKNKYQFDFVVNSQNEGFYDKEIYKLGGKIFYVPAKSANIFEFAYKVYKIVKINKYKYCLRMSSHSFGAIDLLIAKLAGARQLVLRSTNAGNIGGVFNMLLDKIFFWLPICVPTVKIAPSTEAAEFVFGKNSTKNRKVEILKNAIPIESYKFDIEKRNGIRKELRLDNKLVVGHIGRFNVQKNHKFLVEVFKEVVDFNDDSILLLVGEGELEKDIQRQIKNLGLNKKVIFAGIRKDVPSLLMAMDVMVFPSFFEGMPNVIIEAQATGLPCVLSNKITKEVEITDNVTFLPLEANRYEWSKIVLNKKNTSRETYIEHVKCAGYDIQDISKQFEELVFKS
ncbi:MAG TPA: glycosyltransferase family 1 protein [Clostridiales bacterium]|nr:glycosyltransferase family 1 protein [Clostridiales bacterium]